MVFLGVTYSCRPLHRAPRIINGLLYLQEWLLELTHHLNNLINLLAYLLNIKLILFCLILSFPLLLCSLCIGIPKFVQMYCRTWIMTNLALFNHANFRLLCSSLAWGLYWIYPLEFIVSNSFLVFSLSGLSFSKVSSRCSQSSMKSTSTITYQIIPYKDTYSTQKCEGSEHTLLRGQDIS